MPFDDRREKNKNNVKFNYYITMEEEIKKYLKENLRIYADFEDCEHSSGRLVITLSLGRETISETKIWVKTPF